MLEIKRYLLHTDLTLQQIAELMNFSDNSNFVKFFKGMEGCTPVQFRKNTLNTTIRHSGRAAHYKYNTFFSNSTDGSPIPGTLYELYNPNDIHRKGTFQNFSLDYTLSNDANSSFTASFLYENSNLDQTIDNKEFAYDGEHRYYDYYSGEPGNPVFHSFQKDETPLDAYRISLNYQKEFENGNSLELGAMSQFVRLKGTYEYDTVNIQSGNFEGCDYFNNAIDLNRDVYAAYAEYSGSHEKLTYIVGLRAEYLDQQMNVNSTEYFEEAYEVFGEIGRDFSETEFEQNKFDIFPTLHLRYQASDVNTFSLAASHRINRPPAKNMAPFLYRRHQEIFEMGDPLLKPEYSWNADLAYGRLLGKHIGKPLKFNIDYSYKSQSVTPQGEDLEFQMMNVALNYTPEKLQDWNFYAKMLDVVGTNQAGGYTGATDKNRNVFRRDWVYDYEGQIVEIGASFTFNQRQEKKRQKLIGNEYF